MAQTDEKAMRERKREFVEGALCECLKEIDRDIDDVTYTVVEGEELVKIKYKQGGSKVAIVTACSPTGIVEQAIKIIKN